VFPKTRWLLRFVARLLELKPELTPAAAVMVAIDAFEETFDVDPAEAAQIYVDGTAAKDGAGRLSAMAHLRRRARQVAQHATPHDQSRRDGAPPGRNKGRGLARSARGAGD